MFYDRLVFDHSANFIRLIFLWLLVENICVRAVLRQGATALICPISYVTGKKISMWLLLAFVEGGREFAVVVATSNGTVVTRRYA